MRHVIVGNGAAAFSALRAIQDARPEDEITVVSGEDCAAYSPALTTYYLAGVIPYWRLFLCNREFYRKSRVRAMLSRKAVGLDAVAQEVHLEGGQALPYDRVLLATGSRPAVPPIPGSEFGLPLWTARQARTLKAATAWAKKVVIIGAGLIGLQVLDALSRRRRALALVEMQFRVLPRVLDEAGARLVEARLRDEGIDLHLGEAVREIREAGGQKEVYLTSGQRLEAEVVVWAAGVRPNTDFLAGSGLTLEQGIAVDDRCRTNLEHVYAAGDVAQQIDPVTGRSQVMATWPNAVAQGQVAGLNMVGGQARGWRYGRVNILAPLGLPVASLGLVQAEAPEDDEIVRHWDGGYRKLVYRRGRLAGAVLVGEVAEAGILVNSIERGDSVARPGEAAAHFWMAPGLARSWALSD